MQQNSSILVGLQYQHMLEDLLIALTIYIKLFYNTVPISRGGGDLQYNSAILL